MGTIAAMVSAASAIEKANTGYDQSQRWSFFDRSTKKLISNKEADCSSTCGAIAVLGGYPVDLSDPFYTGTFRKRLIAAGFTAIRFTLLSKLKAGDFVLNESNHVEFCPTASTMFSAAIDENGRATGGKTGDQTGREVRTRAAYVYSKGWQWILRPPAQAVAETVTLKSVSEIAKEVIAGKWDNGTTRMEKLKAAGYDADAVQAEVNRQLQSTSTTSTASPSFPTLMKGSTGDAVKTLQMWLRTTFPAYKDSVSVRRGQLIDVDGLYLNQSAAWVLEFQKRTGLYQDGVFGPASYAKAKTYGFPG